jgi:hypothetical protein
MLTRRRIFEWTASLVITGALAYNTTTSSDDDNFREDVLACENAVATIESCCPDVHAPNDACLYHHYTYEEDCGCMSGSVSAHDDRWPVLDLTASRAILAKTCDEIAGRGDCPLMASLVAKPNASASSPGSCSDHQSSVEL